MKPTQINNQGATFGSHNTTTIMYNKLNKHSGAYEVSIIHPGQEDEDYTHHKEYKTYKAASEYARKISLLHPSSRVELLDTATDKDEYEEEYYSYQEYSNGKLFRDGDEY